MVFYVEAPSFSSFRSSPSATTPASGSPAPTSDGTQRATPGGSSSTADPPRVSSTTTTRAPDDTDSAEEKTIQLADPAASAKPFQTVPIRGTYHGAGDTFLRVELWDGGTWQAFPLPAKTDRAGRFTAYVELGRPGRYRLRVLDPDSGVASKSFVLVIKG